MLNLDDPQTRYIFAIAREDDVVLSIAKRMTLIGTAEKALLLPRALAAIAKMREICIEGWGNDREKLDAIELLQKQITEFAAVKCANNFVSDWQGKVCTVCDSKITNLVQYNDMLYCPKCIEYVAAGRHAVDRAFGLWCI